MAGVIAKFVTASLFMWIAPVAILYGYNNNLIPASTKFGLVVIMRFLLFISRVFAILRPNKSCDDYGSSDLSELSPHTLTLLSGFLAVVSVNIVIAFYIYMAMKEPSDKHEPDPAFLAEAKASINQSTADAGSSSQSSKKEE